MNRMELYVIDQDGVESEYAFRRIGTDSDAVIGEFLVREFNRARAEYGERFLSMRAEIV